MPEATIILLEKDKSAVGSLRYLANDLIVQTGLSSRRAFLSLSLSFCGVGWGQKPELGLGLGLTLQRGDFRSANEISYMTAEQKDDRLNCGGDKHLSSFLVGGLHNDEKIFNSPIWWAVL